MYYKKYISDRIYFSPIVEEDYQLYTKWLNDEEISKGINQVHNIITENFEKNWIEHAYDKGRYQFEIVLSEKDKAIGICGLELTNNISKRYHIVCFIGEKEYWNKGYGTEAIKLLTKFAFEILNAHSIYSTIYSFNIASLKAVKKVGFKEVGRFSESVYYNMSYHDEIMIEILKKDYKEKED